MPPPVTVQALTIPNGATVSNVLDFTVGLLQYVKSLMIFAPPAISGVITVEVADVKSPVAADFRTLQSGGADVNITADDATTITPVAFKTLRLLTTIAPGADEVHDVTGREDEAH